MNKLIDSLLLRKYRGAGDRRMSQARSLAFILIGLVVVAALIAVVLQNPKDKILVSAISLGSLLLLILVRSGKAELAGIIAITFLSVICVVLVFTTTLRTFFMLYQLAFLEIFVLSITLLITSRSIHAVIVTVIGVVSIAVNHVFRAMPILIDGEPPTIDDPIIAASLLLFSGLIVIGSNRRGRAMYEAIERESGLNRAKAENMAEILEGLQDDFNTGDQLVNSSNVLTDAVSELSERVDIIQDRMNSVSESSRTLTEAGTSIASISQAVSTSSEEQTTVVEETSAAITQMASAIQEISRIAESRKVVVAGLAENATGAESVLVQSTKAMADLRHYIQSLEDVNQVISDIADQTGLLAMNAAIEAAHAGDSGRGFAVVAGEVRKLSDNSAANVKRVSDMLQEISSSVERAVDTNASVTETFQSIRASINDVVIGMDEILSGVGELANGTSEINTGTAQSVTATQQVRENIMALHDRIEGISDSIRSQMEATGLVAGTLGETTEQLAVVDRESRNVRSVGEQNADNLRSLQSRLAGE